MTAELQIRQDGTAGRFIRSPFTLFYNLNFIHTFAAYFRDVTPFGKTAEKNQGELL